MLGTIDFRKHFLGLAVIAGALVWVVNTHPLAPQHTVAEVDVAGAKQLIDSGALVVDVRGAEQFNVRHLPGAILLTLDELRAGIPARLADIARDRPVVVYCGDGLSHGPEGTALLNKAGFNRAVNLKSGIEGWTAAGQAITKG